MCVSSPDEPPLVSIVMPIWNVPPEYVRAAILGLLAQTFQRWELVIVEDPSDRLSSEVLAQFADRRLRYILNPSRTSLAQQRNRCIQEAKAGIIACHDADDTSTVDRIGLQYAYLLKNPEIGVLGCQLHITDQHSTVIGQRHYPLDHDSIHRCMHRFNAIAQPSVMFRKEIIVASGGYRIDGTCEDYDLWSRLLKAGVRFANLPQALVRYRIHSEASKVAQLRLTLINTLSVKERYWRPTMTFRDRVRLCLERTLLLLPPKLVLLLFQRIQYRPLDPKIPLMTVEK